MRWVTRFFALSLTLVAAGCLGGGSMDPGNTGGSGGAGGAGGSGGGNGVAQPPTALQLFTQNVQPILAGACASCHAGPSTTGPAFLGSVNDQTMFYGALTVNPMFVNNNPQQSALITHKHQAGNGVDLTAAQQQYVIDWLQQENVEHVLPPPPTAGGSQAAAELAKFAKCMTQTDYNSAGMNDLQNQDTTGQSGQCWSCHQTGYANVYLSTDATMNLTMLQGSAFIQKFVEASLNPDGTFKDIVQTYRFRDRGQSPGHPQYTLSAARSTALDTFFMDTYTKYKAGTCP